MVNADAVDPELLQMAARLALSSQHPLAQALARESASHIPYDIVTEEPGQGVRAMLGGIEARLGSAAFCGVAPVAAGKPGASHIYFVYGSRAATIAISQKLRPDAVEVVEALRKRGLMLHILSGDRADAVRPVAATLGIAKWLADVKPAEKIAFIDALKRQGHRVLMVGDGLNDAPALAAAQVSLSPIAAADVTQAQADAVFLGERLKPVLDAVTIARRARGLMKQNLWFAAIYNMIAVPIAIVGWITPLIAALAMSGSSMMVTLNALRGGKAA